jgi:hypothetical protein
VASFQTVQYRKEAKRSLYSEPLNAVSASDHINIHSDVMLIVGIVDMMGWRWFFTFVIFVSLHPLLIRRKTGKFHYRDTT